MKYQQLRLSLWGRFFPAAAATADLFAFYLFFLLTNLEQFSGIIIVIVHFVECEEMKGKQEHIVLFLILL